MKGDRGRVLKALIKDAGGDMHVCVEAVLEYLTVDQRLNLMRCVATVAVAASPKGLTQPPHHTLQQVPDWVLPEAGTGCGD